MMNPSYSRPVLSVLFYCVGVLVFAGFAIYGAFFFIGGRALVGNVSTGMSGILALSGVSLIFYGVVAGALLVAVGYALELLSKIELNTRQKEPAYSAVKQFFIKEGGRERGPFNAIEMLNFYRDGKLTNITPIFVEENGQRRQLNNWSEIGL